MSQPHTLIEENKKGGAAQIGAMKKNAGGLRIQLAQFRELAAFAQFGSDLDKDTQQAITRGQRMIEILKQPEFEPVAVEEQILAIYAATSGALDDVPVNRVSEFEKKYVAFARSNHGDVLAAIRDGKKWTDDIQKSCDQMAKTFKGEFLA